MQPDAPLCRGSGDSTYTRETHATRDSVVGRGDQPEAGDGQRGRYGVAERLVLLVKPGNAGGGKGPQFKAGAESGKAWEIGATLGNSGSVRELRKVPHAEAKEEPGLRSGKRMTAQAAELAVVCRTYDSVHVQVTRTCMVDRANCR